MDGARGLRRHMAGDAAGEGELGEKPLQARLILGHVGVELTIGALQICVGHQRRPAVTRASEVDHVQIILRDEPVEVHVDEVLAWRGAPVPQQPGLDVLQLQRLLKQGVVVQVDLADGEVIGRPPIGVHVAQELRGQWRLLRVHLCSPSCPGGAIVWSDSYAPAPWPLMARLAIQMTARGGWYAPWQSRSTAPGRSGGGRPRLPASRAARLGKSSAVACAYPLSCHGVLQGTCHVTPHPRRAPQLIAEKGPWATRQCGGPAPCERGRADRLSDVSRLARAAAPHSAYRYAAPGRHRLLSTCIDNGARILYICVDTCRHADPAESARGHVTHLDPDPPDRLSVAEEAAMIDLAAYVLEPLHQEGACLLT